MTSILDLPQGMHEGVPHDVYHQRHLGLVSKSSLDLVHRSLAHYQAWVCGAAPVEETPALAFGGDFHCALLEPDRFASSTVVEPSFGDCRKKENKTARDEWRARVGWDEDPAKSKVRVIDKSVDEHIRGMIKAVHAHPIAGKAVRDGIPELTLRWKDQDTGLQCKTRADYYVKGKRMVVDFKSAQDASEKAFTKAVANYRYHVTDALYRASFSAVGEPIQHYMFVVVEKTPPYAIATYVLDIDAIHAGHNAAVRDMARLATAVQNGEFPGYPVGIVKLELPPWAA
jgi:hypothetical protein